MAHVFFEAPIVSSFESILERLITDENLEEARARPELASALIAFGEFAKREATLDVDMDTDDAIHRDVSMNTSSLGDLDNSHDRNSGTYETGEEISRENGNQETETNRPSGDVDSDGQSSGGMTGLLNWLADLAPAVRERRSWMPPPQQIDRFRFTKLTPNCHPATFPKLGAPVRVALEELKEKPFVSHQSSLVMTHTHTQTLHLSCTHRP